jgi:rhomboid protease GluP
MWGFAPLLGKVVGPRADLPHTLLVLCVALFGMSSVLFREGGADAGILSLLAPSGRALGALGMTGGDAWSRGHYWTVLTYAFLHGGLLHIGFNMMWLRSLGPEVVSLLGPARFFVVWSLGGAGAALASNLLFGAPPTVGASGSLFALMGVLVAFGRRRGGVLGRDLVSRVGGWALVAGAMGFLFPNVNNAAHGGGLIAGLVLGYLMPRSEGAREKRATSLLAIALMLATLGGFAASVATHALG